MSLYETVDSLDASGLAWIADRLSLLALPPEQARWFENLADRLGEIIDLDTSLHAGCHSSEDCDADAELAELRAALGEHLMLNPEHGPAEIAETLKSTLEALADAAKAKEEEMGKLLEHARSEGHKDALVPSRQDAASKGKRLLLEARINVQRIETDGELAGLIVASCRGDSGEVYKLGYDPRRRAWRCTCPEMRGNCSHLHALKLVTTVNVPTTGG